jgi:hypothetical protein
VRRNGSRSLRRQWVNPLVVTLIVASVWTIWAVGVVRREPVGARAYVGTMFLAQGAGSSEVIDRSHVPPAGTIGYDGQFFYYMALDPSGAPAYLDKPASYRYARALYPFTARAAALGRPDLIPWTLLLVNLLALVGGTLALALLLQRRGASPFFALLFGFAPGLYEAVNRDLSEPFAYSLVLAALAAWWWDEKPRPWLAGIVFGLAGITRETTLIFPVVLAAAALFGLSDGIERHRARDRRSAIVLVVLSLSPFVALRIVLLAWLGNDGSPEAASFPLLPFGGLLSYWPLNRVLLEQVWGVVAPSLVAVVLVAVYTRRLGPSLLVLICNVAVLVVFLPAPSYESIVASSRITLGVTCAFISALPVIPAAHRAQVALVVAVLAMAPWYDLLPTSLGR